MNRATWFASVVVAAVFCAQHARAAIIEIQLVDVDIAYDSSTGLLTSDGVLDDLSAAFFFLDGAQVDSFIPSVAGELAIALEIPGVTGLSDSIVPSTVTSSAGGSLDVLLPLTSSSFLELTLTEVDVTFTSIATGFGSVELVFAGTLASVDSQDLPSSLLIGSPVSVSLLATVSSFTSSGGIVETFTASGTGSIEGAFIPEPSTICLLAIAAGVAAAGRRVRHS